MRKRISMMKFLVLLLVVPAISQAEWHDDVKSNLEKRIKRSGIPKSELGVIVSFHDGITDVPIYSNNQDKLFIPASLSKLVTGAATLKEFPVGHQFKTHLLSLLKFNQVYLKVISI